MMIDGKFGVGLMELGYLVGFRACINFSWSLYLILLLHIFAVFIGELGFELPELG